MMKVRHLLLILSAALFCAWTHGAPTGATSFKTLKIGAGGQITKIDIQCDQGVGACNNSGTTTKLIVTDTYGLYWWNAGAVSPGNAGGTGRWDQLVNLSSMPTGEGSIITCTSTCTWTSSGPGVFDAVIAPSNTSRFYMMFNDYVYRTDNRGTTWTRTAFVQSSIKNDANVSPKLFGHFMAVDPANADVVYVGQVAASASVSTGVSVSTDAGATWNTVSGITAPASSGGVLVAFDRSAGTQGSGATLRTKNVYISSYGTGAYISTNGGTSFALTASGRPTTHRHMKVSAAGVVWFIDNSSGSTAAWTYNGTTWVNNASNSGGNSYRSSDIDPNNSSRVVLIDDSGQAVVSTNGGTSFGSKSVVNRVATDIPWMQATNGDFLGVADVFFDPAQSNVVFVPGGIGVWAASPINAGGTTNYTSQSAGIEQLVSNMAVAPLGGKPVFSFLDKPVFYSADPNVYPSTHGVNQVQNLMEGYSIDYTSTTPGTVEVFVQNLGANVSDSAASTDGGQTWTIYTTAPGELTNATHAGGAIAASSPSNILIQVSGCGSLYNSKNSGLTWVQLTIGGATDDCGWHHSSFLNRQNIAADRVDADTLYAFNDGSGVTSSLGGFWKSTDKGDTWSQTCTIASTCTLDGGSNENANIKLRAVPGRSGELFFTAGQQSPPYPGSALFWRSTNHAATWTSVANVKSVWAFGFGAAKPAGGGYPAIFIYGWVSNVLGIWRSDDNCATWTAIDSNNGYPNGSLDNVKWIEGDANTYGTVYVGFGGSGVGWGKLNFLLNRDLNPTNDNTPMGLNAVA